MDLKTYLDISGRWLIDSASTYDLAESMFKLMNPSYKIPQDAKWERGPYANSWKGAEALQETIPLMLKTSIEAAKAAELAMGDGFKPDSSGKTRIPFVNNKAPRIGEIIARAGIISQFELWKKYAKSVNYPTNRKQAENFLFKTPEERAILHEIVDLRNSLTHEVELKNDPTMRNLIEYAYKCHYLSKQANEMLAPNPTQT